MENLLITSAEVIELAFSPHDRVSPVVMTDSRIETAQLRFLKPVLKTLYPRLTEGEYADFCTEYIKPALAHFVKYHLFLSLAIRIGDDGIIRPQPTGTTPLDSEEVGRLRRESRKTAYLLLEKAFDYLKDHAGDFPEFDPQAEIHRPARPRMRGGILI
ncbi:MAG: hypothetical protein LBM20_04035 [Rikenellaceae bacterium]|jgi:hypothetical protein|nr:hypothetical protein [Rikenellaceae bacterium]